MGKATRVTLIGVLVLGALSAPVGASAQERPAIAEQIAKTYGLDSWEQIDAIRYTWNIDLGKLKLSRSWVWEPKTGQVSYEGPDKAGKPLKVTYSRAQLASQDPVVKEWVDPGFQNDEYTLLFPLHLAWDKGTTVEDAGMQKLHTAKGSARKVVVKYPSGGGYTPGDTWGLYVGNDGRIRELEFHHGGAAKPSVLIVTWADHKKAGPLLLSLDKRGTADGKPARIWFTKVAVRLAGSRTWLEAK
jgi:hypothetical protein